MPQTLIQSCSDPEQLEGVYTSSEVEITPTGHEPFRAHVTRLDLELVRLLCVNEASARIKWAAQPAKRAFIRFCTQPGDVVVDGATLGTGELVYHRSEHNYYEYSAGASCMSWVLLPADYLEDIGAAVSGCDLSLPCDARFITPPPDIMATLQVLHAESGLLAEKAPHILEIPEVARGLEQSLIHALVGCLSEPDHQASSWARQSHDTVMHRFHRFLEEIPDRALYVPEICAAIRVPERTLRLCCQERLHMSPKQYLLLRRMHLARRVLGTSSPADTTVTDVATQFGFWHFGRFSGTYRKVFDELPSVTLERGPR